jgi:hydroxymethylbilane synthase
MKKALAGDFAAVVLARAGVERLGLLAHVTEVLSTDLILPAPGQGALGIEARADDCGTCALLASLEDPAARAETTAERSFLQSLGGGCQVPIGALAREVAGSPGSLRLEGMVADPGGVRLLRGARTGAVDHARDLGEDLAAELLQQGAGEILAALGAAGAGDPGATA